MYPILRVGSRGPEVVQLKNMLAAKGAHPSSDDPRYYVATADAVRWYQQTHLGSSGRFLVETEPAGVVTEEMWKALEGRTVQKLGLKLSVSVLPKTSMRRKFLAQLAGRHSAGTAEVPKGSNWGDGVVTAIKWNGFKSPIPWCNAEMNYDLAMIGVEPVWKKCCRVCETWNIARKHGMAFTIGERNPCPGDLFVMLNTLRKDGTAPDQNGHIGAVAGINSPYFLTYEGNSDDRFRAGKRGLSSPCGWIKLWDDEVFKVEGKDWQSTDGANDR